MSTTSFAWVTLLFLPICLHTVASEKLQFLAIPDQQKRTLSRGSNVTLDCTTNNQTAHTAVYYRRRVGKLLWKKIEAIPGKIVKEGQIHTLLNASRANKGQYQCRAWENVNSTVITWPQNVGLFNIREGLGKPGSKRPQQKRQGPKRPGLKRTAQKKPLRKRPEQKRPGQKGRGQKKAGQKRPGHKKPGHKKPGHKKPGNNRPGQKRPGSRKPGSKRPARKRPGSKKSGSRKQVPLKQFKQGLKPKVKILKKSVTFKEGSLVVLKCSARAQRGSQQPRISWYRSSKLIGCSNKKNPKCASLPPYVIDYRKQGKRGGKIKVTSFLKIVKAKRARDQDSYECAASNKYGSTRRTIRLKIAMSPS